jgi:hypothetical protein
MSVKLNLAFVPYDSDIVTRAHAHGELGRVFLHECLHTWQLLSESYLTRIAVREMQDVLSFAESGTVTTDELAKSEAAQQDLSSVDGAAGFSAFTLAESACRWWDIATTDPESIYTSSTGLVLPVPQYTIPPSAGGAKGFTALALHEAMWSQTEYADPYRILATILGVAAPFTFPALAHCALQTLDPPRVAMLAAETIRSGIQFTGSGSDFHQTSMRLAVRVQEAVMHTCTALSLPSPKDGIDVVIESGLAIVPIWGHYVDLYRWAAQKHGYDRVALAFALPGWGRSMLHHFRPVLTLLDGGSWLSGSPGQVEALNEAFPSRLTPEQLELFRQMEAGLDEKPRLTTDSVQALIADLGAYAERVMTIDRELRLKRLLLRKTRTPES